MEVVITPNTIKLMLIATRSSTTEVPLSWLRWGNKPLDLTVIFI